MEASELQEKYAEKYTKEDMENILEQMRRDVVIKDRKYHGKSYKQCFFGKDLVQWFQHHNYAESVEEALALGQSMVQRNLFHHVERDHQFKNQKLYYRLWSDEKEKGSAEGDGSWHDLLDDHEGMLEGEELKEALSDVSDLLEKYPSLEELLIDEHNCTTMDHC